MAQSKSSKSTAAPTEAAAEAPAATEALELRRNPENPLQGAYRTGPGVTAGEWFIFHRDHGGGYGDGVREGVEDWPTATFPDNA